MEIDPQVPNPQNRVPPAPKEHPDTGDKAPPAARRRARGSSELEGLPEADSEGKTRRRRRSLFKTQASQTPSPGSARQAPGASKKEIVRAADGAISEQVRPNPVEALNASLPQIEAALSQLRRSLPPEFAEIFDLGAIETMEDFLAGSDKLLETLEQAGLLEALMEAMGPENAESAQANAAQSERRSRLQRAIASPYVPVISLAIVATLLKTAAWYGLPSVSDDTVLASVGLGALAHPALRKVVATAAKIVGSWLIALTEYIPFTTATSIADKNDINLAKFRGILQPIDLGAFLGAAAVLDHEKIAPHHYIGFAIVIAGSTLANWPDNELPPLQRMLRDAAKPDSAMSNALASIREHTPILKNKDPRESRSQLRTRRSEALALAQYLNEDVTAQLKSLETRLQRALASRELAVADGADSEPTEFEAELGKQLRKVEKMLAAAPRLSEQLEDLAKVTGEQSEQKAKRMKTLFTRAW